MSERIPHWLTKQASLAPNDNALELESGESITYSELMQQAQSFAKRLATLGVTKDSKVGIFSTNCKEMVVAIHALSYLEAVVVLFNIRLTKSELTYQIEDADVSQIIVADKLNDYLTEMKFQVPIRSYIEIKSLAKSNVPLSEVINLQDQFTIMYTSGTTGNPKGVVHTYGNHWWSATSSALNLGLHKDDKWLAMLPLFHIGGFSLLMKSVIYGMPIYLLEKFEVEKAHDAIVYKNVTIASVVTVMLHKLIDYLGKDSIPKRFRCMLLGGGPAPKSLLEKSKEKLIPVFQSYGMTETSSQIVTLSPADALRKLGSAGKPLFPAQLKIINADQDGIGEITVKGPMVTKGYYKNEHATEKSINQNWLSTGDLGKLDEEGFLYVVDRRKDLIISGGENIYPTEVENVLASIKGIHEVGVTGVVDEKWGMVPAAFIVPTDETLTKDTVIAYASRFLAKYKLPKYIYFVDELPRNASNKLLRNRLNELIKEE